ncbi:SH3 domain-containing protein [Flavobacterium sp. ov086]|uniref:SH3 domain-containing protein n=1 Tax=Flavobacterium sp. ov086 TaxID=1761785 RepID=UPI000B63E249|nr:SH3 domain-containing protein [Flavobacterium sp. ov086]SNR31310.1 SH3 domain-containing protein [Flavobacterium sp. ov086]
MKSKIFIIILSLCIISCKDKLEDKKQSKNIESMNILSEAPYNISDEGDGKKFNYDTLPKKYIDKGKIALSKRGFRFPDNLIFNKKIDEVYKFDINRYNNKILALRNAMFPEIVIKNDNYIFIQDEEFEQNDFINEEFLFYYNDYVFYNSKVSFQLLKAKYPESLKDLVILYGYVKDDQIAKFVLEKYNYKSFEEFKNLIFDKTDNQYKIREDVLEKIVEYSYHGMTEDLSYAKEGDGFSRINNILEFISKNQNQILNPDKTIAVLFEKELEVGISGDIEYKLNSNSSYKQFLIKNDFFQHKRLKEYVENLYGEDPNSSNNNITYKIQDADGYTNLRKEKNSTSIIVEKVKSGEKIEVLDNSGDWWLVQTNSGNKGYIYKSKIKSE